MVEVILGPYAEVFSTRLERPPSAQVRGGTGDAHLGTEDGHRTGDAVIGVSAVVRVPLEKREPRRPGKLYRAWQRPIVVT